MEHKILEIGRVLGPYTGCVDRDACLAYAAATNDPSQEYLAGAVPPLFTTADGADHLRAAGVQATHLPALADTARAVNAHLVDPWPS